MKVSPLVWNIYFARYILVHTRYIKVHLNWLLFNSKLNRILINSTPLLLAADIMQIMLCSNEIWTWNNNSALIYKVVVDETGEVHQSIEDISKFQKTTSCAIQLLYIWRSYLFIYLFILTLFTVDLKLLIYTKKSLYSLYSNNIELTDVNSVTEQEMQSFPNQFLKSMWTSWQTHTHLYTHSSKHHSRERLHSCAVSFLVFTV